jgi:hypothetical protein
VIRAFAHDRHGAPVVFLGLEDENLRRLSLDQPIKVNLRHLDPGGEPIAELPDLELVIYAASKDGRAWMSEHGIETWRDDSLA